MCPSGPDSTVATLRESGQDPGAIRFWLGRVFVEVMTAGQAVKRRRRCTVWRAVRLVRAPPGLVWRAFDAGQAIGAARAFLRPDNRWFIVFDTCSADCYQPLLAAVAENVGGDLYTTARETDEQGLDRLTRLGYGVNRRESSYLIPTDPAVAGLDAVPEPEGIVIISAADADEDQVRVLDDALRQDVPGTAGWKWDPGDFREETFDSDQFDPATYLIAVDTDSCEYIWRPVGVTPARAARRPPGRPDWPAGPRLDGPGPSP